MKLEEHSLQNEKKEANYEKILFPAGAAGGVGSGGRGALADAGQFVLSV